jgi:hypothetical protein
MLSFISMFVIMFIFHAITAMVLVFRDDHVFLIMGMSMPATFEGIMLGEHLC